MHSGVSIVIPAKNESKGLAACLQAIQCAKGGCADELLVEIILVDNGSTDTTREIAFSYGCKIIEAPEATTISTLRNLGALHAKNDILAFLDADCIVAPEWLRLCIDDLQSIEGVGMVGTPAVPDLSNATWIEQSLFFLMAGSSARPNFVKWLGTSNIFIYKKFFEQVGGFDETLKTAEDVNFCYAITKENKSIYLEKRINTIHTRESKTLRQLFKRELWRGKNSLISLINNNFSTDEILSVLVPAVNLTFFILFLLGLVLSNSTLAASALFVILSLPAMLMVKKRVPLVPAFHLVRYYIISFVYLIARSSAFVIECAYLTKVFLLRCWQTELGGR